MRFIYILLLCLPALIGYNQSTGYSFNYGGQNRTYRVYLPTGFSSNTSLPLVINLHGLGSNGQQQELYTLFDNVADTARCVVAYPDGISNQWNVVIGCTGSSYPCTGIDDVGFISALIDTMHTRFNIDLARVYACGMSDGGYMTFRLACELSCRIAAGASVTGLLQEAYPLYPQCNPTRKVPIIQIHGTADSVVPYSNTAPKASVASTVSRWQTINSCPSTPVVTNMPNINTSDSCTATENYYGLCGDSTLLIQYTINGGGHTWPGSNPLAPIGVTNRDINASSIIWNFFKHYSLPANVSFTGLADTYCSDAAIVTLTGNPGGGSFSGTGVSGHTFNPSAAGNGPHTVTYSVNALGCTYTTSQTTAVTTCNDLNVITANENFLVYPNPANNILNIQFRLLQPAKGSVTLYDVAGKTVLSTMLPNKTEGILSLNTNSVPAGVYILKISDDSEIISKKIVKY
jgi:polyhydroxybutyrate depolymerase